MSTQHGQKDFSWEVLVILRSGMPSDTVLAHGSPIYELSKFRKVLKIQVFGVNLCALGFWNVLHSRNSEFLEAAADA